MLPYLPYHQSIEVNRKPDELFKLIDGEDLTQKMFQSNKYNLIAELEGTEPLVYSFKQDMDLLGRKNAYRSSSILLATLEPLNSGSKVKMTVKTNASLYMTSIVMFIGLVLNLVYKGPIISNIIFVLVLGSIIYVDLKTRKFLLQKTRDLLNQ